MFKEVNTFHSGRYVFDSRLGGDALAINDVIDFLDNTPVFPESLTDVNRGSDPESVYYNGLVEKSSITYDQVESIIKHDRSNFTQDMSALESVNIFLATGLADNSLERDLTPELIHDVHNELISGISGIVDKAGQYRNGGLKADEQWLEKPYTPVASTLDINFLVKNLTEWLTSPEMKDVNPIVKGLILHLNLKKIQPYHNGNGHTARIIERWFLQKEGYGSIANILCRIYAENVDQYYLAMSKFYESSDINTFISFVASKLNDIFKPAKEHSANLVKLMAVDYYLDKLLEGKSLIKRQHAFVKLIKDENLSFSQEDLQLKKVFVKLYGKVSRTTVARDIAKLEQMSLIKSNGDIFSFNRDVLKF